MQITYLGHAGFIAETNDAIVIMDPWLSPTGAFDSSWFQLPRNHHLVPAVHELLRDARRSIYIYVSHEHQDHLDIEFLNSLPSRRFSLLLPAFSRLELAARFANYRCEERILFHHHQQVQIPGGVLKFYVDDSQLNRDSAILMRAGASAFLNMNDCKLFDALPGIVREDGPINVFACQFSGATWHPTCYEYSVEKYESIAKKKSMAKFESVAKAIDVIRPDVYIPSAGPVCFLDPMLFHLNFERVNIFPRARKIIDYLGLRLRKSTVFTPEMMPGDVLDARSGRIVYFAEKRFDENAAQSYIAEYAASYREYFEERNRAHGTVNYHHMRDLLRLELEEKLEQLSLSERVKSPLYFGFSDSDGSMLRVDFARRAVEYVSGNNDSSFYQVEAPAWQVAKVLSRELTWEELSLTFRIRLKRKPDLYDPILHAFLIMEADDLARYCELIRHLEADEERIVIEAAGQEYSVRRYCPHQGGDLSCGWIEGGRFLTCPRHRWQFDLLRDGVCTSNATTVQAILLEQEVSSTQRSAK
jgi:UDP-MurNAc hydroxylase